MEELRIKEKIRPILESINYYSTKKRIKHHLLLHRLHREDNRRNKKAMHAIKNLNYRLLPKVQKKNNLTVSLTTVGKRIESMAPYAIYSILCQTYLPNRIVLNLDKTKWNNDNLPDIFEKLQIAGLEINFCEDVGPHTKFLPTLAKYPNDIIITVDDDIYYEPNMIDDLMDTYKKQTQPSVVCRWATIMEKKNGEYIPYDDWKMVKTGKEPGRYAPLGVAGVLYPPHVFSDEIFKKDIYQQLCPKADDVWFMFMECRENIPVVLVEHNSWEVSSQPAVDRSLDWFETDNALSVENCCQGGNNRQIKALADYYAL